MRAALAANLRSFFGSGSRGRRRSRRRRTGRPCRIRRLCYSGCPAAPGVPAASVPARPDPNPDTEPDSIPITTPQTAPDQALQAQEYIRQYANCLRATLQDHPNTVILLMTHPISTPEQLSLLAGVLASLARSGFTPTTETLALITSVSVYTTGFVAAEVVPPAGTSDDAVAKPGSGPP